MNTWRIGGWGAVRRPVAAEQRPHPPPQAVVTRRLSVATVRLRAAIVLRSRRRTAARLLWRNRFWARASALRAPSYAFAAIVHGLETVTCVDWSLA